MWAVQTSGPWRPHHESLFALGNGVWGSRAHFAEQNPGGTPGTFRNGFAERLPFCHAEWAYGFPTEFERTVPLPEPLEVSILLDSRPIRPPSALTETLDLQNGTYQRRFTVQGSAGAAHIVIEKLISFTHPEAMAMRVSVRYPGKTEIDFTMGVPPNGANETNDPRVASAAIPLTLTDAQVDPPWQRAVWLTEPSQKRIDMALRQTSRSDATAEAVGVVATEAEDIAAVLRDNAERSFAEYAEEQRRFLDAFWRRADVRVDAPEVQRTIRWSLFQLLQSAGVDGRSNIAAKGLTGEGYGGHTFWDTEMYILPVFARVDPKTARGLLRYRANMLPEARRRAGELGHARGAAYPWRTVTGQESSGYFPAGTAQYHLNADIAYAFVQDYLITGDTEFLATTGAEVILETARIWTEIGNFDEEGVFHIHTVTGPDEYTALVSDNHFTNRMAQFHLRWAVKTLEILREKRPEDAAALEKKLRWQPDESERMRRAADAMALPIDDRRGVSPQDSVFLTKPEWTREEEPDKEPLLLRMHPLTIYRYQYLKQPDVVLSDLLFSHETPPELRARNYAYYEPRTSHDSSLSGCAHALAAASLGKWDEAQRYYRSALALDMENTHGNTEHGLHMANLGGTVLMAFTGWGGLQYTEAGFRLAPVIRPEIGGYSFSFAWRGHTIRLQAEGEVLRLRTDSDEPIAFHLYGTEQILREEGEYPLRNGDDKAVLFDLDGVLTDTSHTHYLAWRELADELGFALPTRFEDELRGISRRASLESILAFGNMGDRFTDEEKQALADRKNDMYRAAIEKVGPADLAPGASELLDAIRTKGGKIALVSASRNAGTLIRKLGIEDRFDAVVDPDRIRHGKPAPDPFLAAAEMLGVLPRRCLGVEDAAAGVASIHAAGMSAVGIGERERLGTFDSFASLSEATKRILEWLEE